LSSSASANSFFSLARQGHRMRANGLPADTNNRHCRDRPQRGAGERGPMRNRVIAVHYILDTMPLSK
jgi:hypothetical protein